MNEFPLYAALDIGSNAARLLFANVIPVEDTLKVYKNTLLRLPLRLGEDVYSRGILSEHKMEMLVETITVFQSLKIIFDPADTAVFATAALREAKNSEEILSYIKRKTNTEIHIIDGIEEARIIKELYEGIGDKNDWKVFADLGGGSLELTILKPDKTFVSRSFKIGAVRALTNSIPRNETKEMHVWLDEHLPEERNNIYFIATGGNINTLKKTFTSPTQNFMTRKELELLYITLYPLNVSQRISKYMIRPDRADVIIPAIKIFKDLLIKCAVNKLYVPGGGLSDGIVLQLHKKRAKSGTR